MWRMSTPAMIERERLEKLDRERRAELHRKAVAKRKKAKAHQKRSKR